MISFVHESLTYLCLTRCIGSAQLGERRPSAERKVAGLNPDRTKKALLKRSSDHLRTFLATFRSLRKIVGNVRKFRT